MGFWIFLLICNLLIPVTMIGFGHAFLKHPPREINGVYGYRTALSMKNQDTWVFAHHHCGRIWRAVGWALLGGSLLAMLLMLGRPEETVGVAGGIVCAAQTVCLILSIIPTQRALKKTFDQYGRRKE